MDLDLSEENLNKFGKKSGRNQMEVDISGESDRAVQQIRFEITRKRS